MKYRTGSWTNLAAASGIIMHRVFAECIRTMKKENSEYLERGDALAILEEVLQQRGVPPEERIRIPLREIPNLRWMTAKFSKDNRFSIHHVVDVEHRLQAPIEYRDDEGELRTRILTGQLDALIADPEKPEEAIIPDWKSGWGIPPKRHEDDQNPGLSYHGFFQQRFYGFLVLKNYAHIKAVTLREFYTRRSEARPARLTRERLPQIEEDLANLVLELDRAFSHGKPKKLDFDHVGPWRPSPGRHCSYCLGARNCPIESDARERYAVTSKKRAEQMVAELEVAKSIVKSHPEALRPYVDLHGPVGSRWSKGRRVFGYKTQKNGPILTFFTPDGSDRAPVRTKEDEGLEDALRKSAELAKKRK